MKMRFSSPLTSTLTGGESWVFSLPIGVPVWTGERMRLFTEKQAGEYVRNTNEALEYFRASASGSAYSFPVKVNHKTAGKRYGDVLEAKVGGDGAKRGVYLRVRWKADTWKQIHASEYQHVSVGVDPSLTLQNGKKLGPLIVELSLTEEPRITSIGTIQDTIGLRLSRARFAQDGEGKMEEVLNALSGLAEATASNSDMLAQILALVTPVAEAVDAGAAPAEFDASTTGDDKKKEEEDEKVALSRLATAMTTLAAQQTKTQQAVERFSRMNLGERGRQGFSAPTTGKPSREQRKSQLQSAGLSKEMVARTLVEEGF